MHEAKWIFSFLGKSKDKLYAAYVLSLLFNALLAANTVIISRIADDVLTPMFENWQIPTSEVMRQLLPLLFLSLGIGLIAALFRFLSNIFREQASQKVTFDLRNALYQKLGLQTRDFFLSNRSGDLINKCSGDVDVCNHFLCWVSFSMIDAVVMLTIVLIVFFSVSWKFTLCEMALAPIACITALRMGKVVRPIFGEARQQLSRLNTVVQENISGNRVVRAFVREPFEIEKFHKENDEYFELQLKANKTWVTYSPILETVANTINATAVIVGSLLAIAGQISVGQLVIFTGMSWMLNSPMVQLGFLINDFQRFRVSCERVRELYYSSAEIKSPEKPVLMEDIKGDVDFDHATLTFDGNPILTDINMHIPAGSTVGIMGPTGSGKSTLFNLLTRFVDVRSGSVKVDGIDVRLFDLDQLRRNIGIALQDVFLFSDTVESNIAYGCPDTPMENVYASAKDADADDFVRKLPDGYDTIVGERGMGLSGGQKQRLALARALAMNSPILILDDTTSAVDLETEQYIQNRLRCREKKATTLIVAQRISSVKNADCIYILEDGRITESGTHKELLEKKGYYYHIYQIQQGNISAEESEVAE